MTARRLLRRLLLFFALGVATSVVVAWGLAVWLPNSHCTYDISVEPLQFSTRGSIDTTTHERPGLIRRAWAVELAMFIGLPAPMMAVNGPIRESQLWSRVPVLGDSWGTMNAVRQRDPRIPGYGFDDARGWPIPCLWYSVLKLPRDPHDFRLRPQTQIRGGFALTSATAIHDADIRALPFLPLWRGLAINSAFYSLAWAIPWAAFLLLRVLLRRRRGLCPRCAYDLRHDHVAGCPECGWNRPTSARSIAV